MPQRRYVDTQCPNCNLEFGECTCSELFKFKPMPMPRANPEYSYRTQTDANTFRLHSPEPKGYIEQKAMKGGLHFHKDENGTLIKCYHSVKTFVVDWKFWASMTLSFPIEHFIWEKVWPFNSISVWLGL